MLRHHDRTAVAALVILFVLVLVLRCLLRRPAGMTWHDALWPRRHPPWWAQLPSGMASVRELARAGLKIQAVKMYREITGADLATSVRDVEAMAADATSDADTSTDPQDPPP